jgi:hypothetical protein
MSSTSVVAGVVRPARVIRDPEVAGLLFALAVLAVLAVLVVALGASSGSSTPASGPTAAEATVRGAA